MEACTVFLAPRPGAPAPGASRGLQSGGQLSTARAKAVILYLIQRETL